MEIKRFHIIGIILAIAILLFSLTMMESRFFFFVFGLGILIGAFPFVFTIISETKIAAEKEEMFLEFCRNLVESVRTGTPINRAIFNVKNKQYGVLSENVRKLANQISIGIPLGKALQTFSKDVQNSTISKALTLIGQAEKSGGEIGRILESVTEAVGAVDKLKKERKAAISALVVQGYIIFFVFIVIILVLQFQILPSMVDIAPAGGDLGGAIGIGVGGGGAPMDADKIASSFIYLLLVQGLFSGLVIGKLSEGSFKTGVRHSFILMLIAFMISTGANLIFGG